MHLTVYCTYEPVEVEVFFYGVQIHFKDVSFVMASSSTHQVVNQCARRIAVVGYRKATMHVRPYKAVSYTHLDVYKRQM